MSSCRRRSCCNSSCCLLFHIDQTYRHTYTLYRCAHQRTYDTVETDEIKYVIRYYITSASVQAHVSQLSFANSTFWRNLTENVMKHDSLTTNLLSAENVCISMFQNLLRELSWKFLLFVTTALLPRIPGDFLVPRLLTRTSSLGWPRLGTLDMRRLKRDLFFAWKFTCWLR